MYISCHSTLLCRKTRTAIFNYTDGVLLSCWNEAFVHLSRTKDRVPVAVSVLPEIDSQWV